MALLIKPHFCFWKLLCDIPALKSWLMTCSHTVHHKSPAELLLPCLSPQGPVLSSGLIFSSLLRGSCHCPTAGLQIWQLAVGMAGNCTVIKSSTQFFHTFKSDHPHPEPGIWAWLLDPSCHLTSLAGLDSGAGRSSSLDLGCSSCTVLYHYALLLINEENPIRSDFSKMRIYYKNLLY